VWDLKLWRKKLTMLILYRYIWLVYVYFGLSADFDYPRQFSPPLPRIIESLLYVKHWFPLSNLK
jgi:hypothetical protein